MRSGKSATDALATLLASDEARDVRQVAMVDAQGRVTAHTATRTSPRPGTSSVRTIQFRPT